MKVIIIYTSIHHGNTEKVAKAIASVLGARLFKSSEVKYKDIEKADLIGFGSGVYLSRFHKNLSDLIKDLPEMRNKKSFLFSTSGIRKNFILNRSHSNFRKILEDKGFKVIGEFDCRGWDTYGPLKLVGGINKGRPNKKDLKKAKKFARSVLSRFS